MHRPAEVVAELVWPGMGAVEAVDDGSCLLHVGAGTPADLAWMVASVGVDFTVTGPPELVDAIRELGERCRHAVRVEMDSPPGDGRRCPPPAAAEAGPAGRAVT
jgi:WYL domain